MSEERSGANAHNTDSTSSKMISTDAPTVGGCESASIVKEDKISTRRRSRSKERERHRRSNSREKDRSRHRRSRSRDRYRDRRRSRSRSRDKHNRRRERSRDRSRERNRRRDRSKERDTRDQKTSRSRSRSRSRDTATTTTVVEHKSGAQIESQNTISAPVGDQTLAPASDLSSNTASLATPIPTNSVPTISHGGIDLEAVKRSALERAKALATQAKANPTPVTSNNVGLMGFMPATSTTVPITNPIQEQKKKLLWGSKKQEKTTTGSESFNQWESTAFDGDEEGQRRAKFLKLMGAGKGKELTGASVPTPTVGGTCEHSGEKQNLHAPKTSALTEIERQFEESRRRQYTLGGANLGLGNR